LGFAGRQLSGIIFLQNSDIRDPAFGSLMESMARRADAKTIRAEGPFYPGSGK
jgi:hypothetical protein